MKKKFTLEIKSPCEEKISNMKPTANGFFCDSCAKNVIDLSRKTNSEIAKFFVETKNQNNICARLKTSQLEEEFEINTLSKISNFKYAAIAATVLLTTNAVGQEKQPEKTEINCPKPNPDRNILGKVAYNSTLEKVISITVRGKLLDQKTNKPINKKTYPNLILTINGSQSTIKINAKTGEFSIPILISEGSKNLMISVNSDDYYLSKMILFDKKSVKKNVLLQNIVIDTSEFSKMTIMGGIGMR
jgi:hypothetical protein